MTTLIEVKTRLEDLDEITLLEMLHISSEEIIERFDDKIEAQYKQLIEEFGDDNTTTE